MKSPFTGKEMLLQKEWREMEYRKEKFQVFFHCYLCEDTGEKFESEEFSALNYNQVINQYRVNHSIPFPEQIKSIRERYGLSAAKMSLIMGMGTNSWGNYEKGEVPSKVHGSLINMINDPRNFLTQITFSDLDDKEKSKILEKLGHLVEENCCCHDEFYRFKHQADINTGFSYLIEDKLKQVVLFFALNQKLYKTKLNKLLWYLDFLHFSSIGKSITGLTYKAISYGPVPDHYEILFELLEEIGLIEKKININDNGVSEVFIPAAGQTFDENIFDSKELEHLEFINNKFKKMSTKETVELSHKEPAWLDNVDCKGKISYLYAFELQTI